jgi:hypothetical protein
MSGTPLAASCGCGRPQVREGSSPLTADQENDANRCAEFATLDNCPMFAESAYRLVGGPA